MRVWFNLTELPNKERIKVCENVAKICWNIWKHRNEIVLILKNII